MELITAIRSHGIKPSGNFKNMTNENIIFIEEVIVVMLLIASGVAVAARHFRVPYTVELVIIGLAITLLNPQKVEFTPQIILLLLVPLLVFEATIFFALYY
jgi:hypothetical protein